MLNNNMSPMNKPLVSPETFFRLVIAAIILRIFLMPFFAHVDVLSEARRIYFWSEQGIYFDNISRNATSLFQLLFFKVFSVFIDNKDMLFAHADMANSTATPLEYFEFVSQPTVYRALFVIKLPFLAADLITAWAMYVYCQRSPGARNAVLFWLFNPVTLFAFYIFGRFESIPIMFCMLSLLAIQRRSLVLAAVMMGLSINSREIFIFLGPLFVALVCSPSCRDYSWKARIISVAVITFAVAVAIQLISLTGSSVDTFGREVSSIAAEGRVDSLFRFIVGSYLMFPMVLFFILLYAWNTNTKLQYKSLLLCAYVIMAFFCLSEHTAHYTSWMMIFPCIFLAYDLRFFKPMLALCVVWFVFNLSITDSGVFTTWLASPWSINFAGLPTFPMMYRAFGLEGLLDLTTYQRICRTSYCGAILYIGFQMMQVYKGQIAHDDNAQITQEKG